MTDSRSLQDKSEAQIRQELRGFPEEGVASVLDLRENFHAGQLDVAIRHILRFYLPKASSRSLEGLPAETRLREDLGVDSLTMAEAAFKLDELFGIPIEIRETAGIETLGDLLEFLKGKLGL